MIEPNAQEKSRLLKEALRIVNELAKNDLADMDGENITSNDFESEKLIKLILRARKISKNRFWDVK